MNTDSEMDRNVQLFLAWRERLYLASTAHYRASETYESRGRFYTKLNMIFAIAVLFSAHNRFFESYVASFGGDIFIAVASLGTVLTAALHYINRYEERAGHHKLAASEFSNLKRKIERYLASNDVPEYVVHSVSRECNYLSKNCPLVERTFWKVIIDTVVKHKKAEETYFQFSIPEPWQSDSPPRAPYSPNNEDAK